MKNTYRKIHCVCKKFMEKQFKMVFWAIVAKSSFFFLSSFFSSIFIAKHKPMDERKYSLWFYKIHYINTLDILKSGKKAVKIRLPILNSVYLCLFEMFLSFYFPVLLCAHTIHGVFFFSVYTQFSNIFFRVGAMFECFASRNPLLSKQLFLSIYKADFFFVASKTQFNFIETNIAQSMKLLDF